MERSRQVEKESSSSVSGQRKTPSVGVREAREVSGKSGKARPEI